MPLKISDIPSLRSNTSLPTTVAPYTSSESFKSPHSHNNPPAKKWDAHFSIECRSFSGSELKQAASPVGPSKIISLGTGRPTADYYPWDILSLQLSPTTTTGSSNTTQSIGKKDEGGYNMSSALNYGHSAGSPALMRFLTEHVELVHNPPYADWGIYLSCGSTSALEIAFRMLCDRGDTLLTEKYTYPGSVDGARLIGLRIQGVDMDEEGLVPGSLEDILGNWDEEGGKRPGVLYTIPTGHNPTGTTQSLSRRTDIYAIAEKYDLIILEDDPYYFLRMDSSSPSTDTIPSYLSLDTSGRVIRLDSTSKILAPGLRAGWVTAPASVISKFIFYQEVSTVAVSGTSQLFLYTLLEQNWGHGGFFTWLGYLSSEYKSRRDVLLYACERYLPGEICSWVQPEYGMFLWVKVDYTRHPSFGVDESDIEWIAGLESRIVAKGLAAGVQVIKGSLFSATLKERYTGGLFFRMTFAAAPVGDLEDGVKIFGGVVEQEFRCII